jgi:hypothetical protein
VETRVRDLEGYDEEAAQREAAERWSLDQSIYWLKAVVYQGMRVQLASQQPFKHVNSADSNTTTRMEEYFFLNACRKAHRWLSGLNLSTPEASRFSALEAPIQQVRNNREHDEERYGVLKNKDEPMRKVEAETKINVTVSSSVTVHSAGRYLLGGIVDLSEVVSAAEALLPSLISNYNEYWNRWFARLAADPKVAESYHIEPRFPPPCK